MNSNDVNTLGLVCDLLGVVILYFFSILPSIKLSAKLNGGWNGYEEEKYKKKDKVHNTISPIGFSLIIIGFLLQVLSNYIH